MNRVDKINENHKKGYNCAQSVACAYCDLYGMDEKDAFRAIEAFGRGMGHMNICGAVSGMAFIAGLAKSDGNLDKPASKQESYNLIKAMIEEFTGMNGSIVCSELKGLDTGKVLRSCTGCMEDAGILLEKYLFEAK